MSRITPELKSNYADPPCNLLRVRDSDMSRSDLSVIVEAEFRRLEEYNKQEEKYVQCGCQNEFIIGLMAVFTFSLFSLFFMCFRSDRHFKRGICYGLLSQFILFLLYVIIYLCSMLY